MVQPDKHDAVHAAALLDEAALDLEAMARACEVDADWVRRHVQAGLLPVHVAGQGDAIGNDGGAQPEPEPVQLQLHIAHWRFRSDELTRARRLARIERDFDAGDELAALVVDLADEVRRLRIRLAALGVR